MDANDLEVIVLVEGTESVTSSLLQARYSYTYDDVEFNKVFYPSVSIGDHHRAVVNFNNFHDVLSLDPNATYHEDMFIQSIM